MSTLYPKNGIIYYYAGTHKSSAVLLDNKFILTSGLTMLQVPFIKREIKPTFEQNIINVDTDPDLNFLRHLDYRLVVQGNDDVFLETKVQIAYILFSPDIKETIENNFKSLRFSLDGEYKSVSEYSIFFSTFVILSSPNQNISLNVIRTAFKNCTYSLNLLEDIVCVNSPFGNEHFLNSIYFGHVANLLGKDNCLALLNISSAYGCEGGGVYDKNVNLRSILLSSCFNHQNENVCLPLAANVDEIFKILFHKSPLMSICDKLTMLVQRSSCMIDSMGSWGTGCLFQINGQSFVLTCAHVLRTDNITCYSYDYVFQPKLIYKNPIFDYAFDIALLEGPENSHNLAKLAKYIPKVGQIVYSVGFPVFKHFGMDGNFTPSIYRGRVTKYTKGVLNTDCPVQAGQSGGPIFDSDGNLLAVMVSNFKNEIDGKIYPCHNMCIPISDIYDVLFRYTKTNDPTELMSLQAEKTIVDKWKLRNIKVECKL